MLSAAYEPQKDFIGCARTEPRTNMFVMAALVTGNSRETVKVRNMSPGGALVEGQILPQPDTQCLLHRVRKSPCGYGGNAFDFTPGPEV